MTTPTIFDVPDMTCGHCEKTIRTALAEQLPGAAISIDLPGHQVTVEGDADAAEAAIRDAGYSPQKV